MIVLYLSLYIPTVPNEFPSEPDVYVRFTSDGTPEMKISFTVSHRVSSYGGSEKYPSNEVVRVFTVARPHPVSSHMHTASPYTGFRTPLKTTLGYAPSHH